MREIDDLVNTMRCLRDPESGCPWDQQQTFDSILGYTLKEVYELAEALESCDWEGVCDELGDLLFHIIYYAQIGTEEGKFDLKRIATDVNNKLVRRHPHVFAGTSYADMEEQKGAWERQKHTERAAKGEATSLLDGVGKAQPAINTALNIQARAASVGFDWNDCHAVLDKLDEEIRELRACLKEQDNHNAAREELGDVLFTCVNLSRHIDVDPELALRSANKKFEKRFRYVEQVIEVSGMEIRQASLEQLDSAWEDAKRCT